MTRTTDTDVIICGTGAAGLTLAIDLARRNVAFLLIDKAPHPFIGSRGKGIQPRSQEVFEDLGVIDRIVASGGEYPVQRIYTDDGPVDEAAVEMSEPTPDEPYQIPLLVPQFLTERRLRERLAELGHAPHYSHELVGFDQDSDGVSARIATPDGEQTVRAAYLIGADGGSSFVRKTLGIDFPGKTLGVRAIVADVLADGVSSDAWHRWGEGTAAQVSMCPLYGTDMFQLQGAGVGAETAATRSDRLAPGSPALGGPAPRAPGACPPVHRLGAPPRRGPATDRRPQPAPRRVRTGEG
jgi:2-polyprenyl-6-methoxyphenol hydroxylase-like FAD-dependent oxidoreductase